VAFGSIAESELGRWRHGKCTFACLDLLAEYQCCIPSFPRM
jgi:hypothetical protein